MRAPGSPARTSARPTPKGRQNVVLREGRECLEPQDPRCSRSGLFGGVGGLLYPSSRRRPRPHTGSSDTLAKLTYAYDENANPTSITDQAGKASTFTYDALDRITKEAHPQKTISYTYDAAGNRKSKVEGSATTSYDYDAAERMTRAGSSTYAYDNNGNMVSSSDGSDTTDYSYDYEDKLVQAGEKTYERDALGRVESSTDGGGEETDYDYDGSQVIREVTASGQDVADYTRGLAGRLISRQQGNTSSYYHHDAIGSVVGLSDGSGALTDTYTYDAFGDELGSTGQSEQPYRYLGNRQDASTGLSDFHARSYQPSVGRFTSKDPVRGRPSKPQSLNPYAGSLNNPLRFPDPSGRTPDEYGSGSSDQYSSGTGDKQYSSGDDSGTTSPSNAEYMMSSGFRREPATLGQENGRSPDYYALTGNAGPFLYGGSGQVTVDRYGNIYFGGGFQGGKSLTLGSVSLTGGTIEPSDVSQAPSEGEIKDFITGFDYNFGGGFVLGGGGTYNPSSGKVAHELGFYTPQLGGAINFAKQYPNDFVDGGS